MSTVLLREARLLDPARLGVTADADHAGGADPGRPVDVLLADGRIVAIGTDEVAAATQRHGAPDDLALLDGRWVLPGLWDHHVHLTQWALTRRRLDVAPARTAAEAGALVRAHLASDPVAPGEVLVGYGFRDALWPDAPSPDLLSAGDTPVCLISADVHTIWSNAAAIRLFGLGEEGWFLREKPAFDLGVRLGAASDDQADAAVAEALHAAARRGVVGIADLEMDDAGAAWLRRRARPGYPRMRIRAAVYPHALAAARARGQRTDVPLSGTDGLVVGGSFKLFTDGALNTRTAYTAEPYPDTVDGALTSGLAIHEPAALVALIREGLAAGIRPTVHAIGDAAVTLALDAFAAAGTGGTMEHAQLVRHEDLPRFAELGVEASVQPEHAMDDRDVADALWGDRADRSFAWRSLLDAGAVLRFGSDAPVAPLDPWVAMSAAVFRSRDGREPWHPEQCLPFAAALAASTRTEVALGAPADLAIVEADPRDADAAALRVMPVAGTLVGGEWTHRGLGG